MNAEPVTLEFEMCPWPGLTYVYGGAVLRIGEGVIGAIGDLELAQRICDLLNAENALVIDDEWSET